MLSVADYTILGSAAATGGKFSQYFTQRQPDPVLVFSEVTEEIEVGENPDEGVESRPIDVTGIACKRGWPVNPLANE